jgi:uncharacterized protein
MPLDWLAIGAALLSGLLGSLHCAAMCGGIAASSALGARRGDAFATALRVNLARIASYTVGGAIAGGIGGGIVALARVEALQLGMRMAVGAVLVVVALRLLDRRGRLGFLRGPGGQVWRWLAPLQRRLLPASTPARQLGLGLLWGWLPCGLSGTLLFAAWFSADALQGAALMAAFGGGTLLTMLPLAWSGSRVLAGFERGPSRQLAGSLVLVAGLATLGAPWLAEVPAMHALLDALGCRTLIG